MNGKVRGREMIESASYKDILAYEKNAIAFDISVNSTGYFIYEDGKITYDTYKLQSDNLQGRRAEFRDFIRVMINTKEFDLIVIEDVIAGNNFKTTQGLIQLNSIIDDMMFYGVIKQSPIVRVGNTTWKKYLRELGDKNLEIKGMKDKEEIRRHLNKLGFDEDVPQDIYDALGMLVGVIAVKHGVIQEHKRVSKKIENDILKFKVKKFYDGTEASKFAKKIATNNNAEIRWLLDKDIDKSLKETVKRIVDNEGEDIVFCVQASMFKLGAVGVKFEIEEGDIIVARNKNMLVNKK